MIVPFTPNSIRLPYIPNTIRSLFLSTPSIPFAPKNNIAGGKQRKSQSINPVLGTTGAWATTSAAAATGITTAVALGVSILCSCQARYYNPAGDGAPQTPSGDSIVFPFTGVTVDRPTFLGHLSGVAFLRRTIFSHHPTLLGKIVYFLRGGC